MNNLYVSNLAFMGLSTCEMKKLPEDLGIEVFLETGNDLFWNRQLPKLLKNHTLPLSVHGPFQGFDLSDPNEDFNEIRKDYIWAFELGAKFGAKDCVCHPYTGNRPADDTPEARKIAKETSLERILELDRISRSYGTTLLIENMPYKTGLLDEKEFIELFEPNKQLRFLIDTGHANLQNWDMAYAYEKLGDRICAYHLSDNQGDTDAHLMVGEGCFDWDGFFKLCTKYTPDANIVLEYNPRTLEEVSKSAESVRHELLRART